MAAKRPLANYAGTAQELAPGDIVAEAFNTPDVFADFVVSGLLSPTSANLTSTLSAGVAYVIGRRVVVAAAANTYTASQDTYVDLSNTGVLTYVAVALGAAAPAVTANSLRLQKVVTDATAVTSVVAMARNLPAVTQDKVAYTTAGTAPAYTLTPTPPLTAYTAGQRFRVKFHAAGTAGTLNISGLGAVSLKQYNTDGAKVACNPAVGQLTDVEYDGADAVVLDSLPPVGGSGVNLGKIAAYVSGLILP